MQTNGKDFQQKLSDTLSEIALLSQKIYNSADINAVIAEIGTKTELFFKAVLFPDESPCHCPQNESRQSPNKRGWWKLEWDGC